MRKHIPIVVVTSLMILGIQVGEYLREQNESIPSQTTSHCNLTRTTTSE